MSADRSTASRRFVVPFATGTDVDIVSQVAQAANRAFVGQFEQMAQAANRAFVGQFEQMAQAANRAFVGSFVAKTANLGLVGQFAQFEQVAHAASRGFVAQFAATAEVDIVVQFAQVVMAAQTADDILGAAEVAIGADLAVRRTIDPAVASWLVFVLVFLLLVQFQLAEANRTGINLLDQDRAHLLYDLGTIIGWSFGARQLSQRGIRRLTS